MDGDAGVCKRAGFDLTISLLLDRCDDDRTPGSTRGIEQQKREAAVAGDQSKLRVRRHRYLMMPRSAAAMKSTR